MSFLGEHYLLTSEPAIRLYQEIAELPIVDPHNHADVPEIVLNRNYSDIWQIEGSTDHYVWALMRGRGIPEELITGSASNFEKWNALAEKMPEMIGNPTYEWIHLDLKRRLGIDLEISASTAEKIWELSMEKLQEEQMRPQALLEAMDVEIMCTTDDPTLNLEFHEKARQSVRHTRIMPTWRPDKAGLLENPGWKSFVKNLGAETGEDTSSLQGLLDALQKTHQHFSKMGCVASDHGLASCVSRPVSRKRASQIHKKAWAGSSSLQEEEIEDYRAFLLFEYGMMNSAENWVTQLHIGAVRNYRRVLFEKFGPDVGADISTQSVEYVENLRYFLNEFDGRLKIVLYCVDPTHIPTLATIARAFPDVTLGAPWWFNDSPYGMEVQLRYLATVDALANHAGMVTDSRKLISFGSRTEMFRRILCEVLGSKIVRGQFPESPALQLARSLSYHRPKELFFG